VNQYSILHLQPSSRTKDVEREMQRGQLKSGKGGKGGTVKNRKQAVAIGLSEARKKGKKVPKKWQGRPAYVEVSHAPCF
jgi:Family of unknown function (DUF6496)